MKMTAKGERPPMRADGTVRRNHGCRGICRAMAVVRVGWSQGAFLNP